MSRDGGSQPRWRKDGKELFFVKRDTLFSVPVSLQPSFTAGAPVRLFSNAAVEWQYWNATYDVSCDGRRFVLIEPHGPTLKASIRIVENWIAELRGGADPK